MRGAMLYLRSHGNTVLRFGNVEVFENLEGVFETIRLKLLELKPEGAERLGRERRAGVT